MGRVHYAPRRPKRTRGEVRGDNGLLDFDWVGDSDEERARATIKRRNFPNKC